MRKIIKLTESELKKLITRVIREGGDPNSERYMFFSNLEQMKRQCEMLLDMDQQ